MTTETEYGTKQRLVRLAIWIFAGIAGLVMLRTGGPGTSVGYLLAPVAWGVVGYRLGTAADRVYADGWTWSKDEAMTTPGKIFAALCFLGVAFLAVTVFGAVLTGGGDTASADLEARILDTEDGPWVMLEVRSVTHAWPANSTLIHVERPDGTQRLDQLCQTARATNGTCQDPFEAPDVWRTSQRLYVGCPTQGIHTWTLLLEGNPIDTAQANCPTVGGTYQEDR